jgi:transposase
MISMEEWTTIRCLAVQGWGSRRIARELGISRNTVRRAIRAHSPPKYERARRVNPQLEPFRDEIMAMLIQKDFIGSRILREIRKRGYRGSPAAFYRYLRKLNDGFPSLKVTERFETPPGRQGQFDWTVYTVKIGGVLTRVTVFCHILCYSRRKHYCASLDETQASIFQAMEESFQHYQGVPQQILLDNPKAFVLKPRPNLEWNPRFLEFCGHYRFEPVACRVGRAQTKGKVERPFFYLENHFIKGNSFQSFEHFLEELQRFESEELDTMVHSTTRQRPIDRFQIERAHLILLPPGRFISTRETFRKVSWDSLISFDGSRYSVPYRYAGKSVWVRTSRGINLEVYSQKGELIALHPLSRTKGNTVILKEHYEGLRKRPPRTRLVVRQTFKELFPDDGLFMEKLLAQYKFNSTHHLREILSLLTSYPKDSLREAFQIALTYNTFSSGFVKGVLERVGQFRQDPVPAVFTLAYVPKVDIHRGLGVYQQFIGGR